MSRILTLLLVLVWLAAGVGKSFSFQNFASSVFSLHLITSREATLWVSVAIIATEFILAGLLLFKPTRLLGLKLSMMMFSVFIGTSVWKWMEGITAPCQCFGIFYTMSPVFSLGLQLLLFVLSGVALWRFPNYQMTTQ